jgi:hypothetical protein
MKPAESVFIQTVQISKSPLSLLRERITGDRYDVTPDNLEAYRELAAAGIMIPISTFTKGPESNATKIARIPFSATVYAGRASVQSGIVANQPKEGSVELTEEWNGGT